MKTDVLQGANGTQAFRVRNANRSTLEMFRVQLKRDGTRWCTGGEVKGKLANGVGSQYSSHYLGTLLPLMRTPRLPVVD